MRFLTLKTKRAGPLLAPAVVLVTVGVLVLLAGAPVDGLRSPLPRPSTHFFN